MNRFTSRKIIITAALTSNLAFGISFSAEPPTDASNNECPSLDGEWAGTCESVEGGNAPVQRDEEMKISQSGCAIVKIDDESFSMGAVNQSTISSDEQWFQETKFPKWDNERSALVNELSIESRSFGPSGVMATSTRGDYELALQSNGDLTVKVSYLGSVTSPDGAVTKFSGNETCTFTKK